MFGRAALAEGCPLCPERHGTERALRNLNAFFVAPASRRRVSGSSGNPQKPPAGRRRHKTNLSLVDTRSSGGQTLGHATRRKLAKRCAGARSNSSGEDEAGLFSNGQG